MHTREPGITAAAAVEMHLLRVGGMLESTEKVVADAAGLEGAGGLQVVELEEDSAALDQLSRIVLDELISCQRTTLLLRRGW